MPKCSNDSALSLTHTGLLQDAEQEHPLNVTGTIGATKLHTFPKKCTFAEN
jgi:hypothetical protein